MASSLRLRILGAPGIAGPSGPLSGPATAGQPLALLAVLACAGERGIPRDKVFALFWPEASADRASHRLSQLVHHVRRGLGCPDLITGSAELRLDRERIAADLWEFTAARQGGRLELAAELYAGPFLDGFFLPDSAGLERWIDSRRASLAREYQETLEALAVHAELRGDPRGAADWWRRLAEHEPLSSRVTMHLMTALAAAGDRARALERAQAYQAQLREELEAEPNPAVLALAAELRRPPGGEGGKPVAIGVLPFLPLDGGEGTRAMALGLTEEVTTALAALPGVRVASRSALLALDPAMDLREVGARLGLALMLEGSVRRSGDRLRLTVRLVDVRDGCQAWSGRYEHGAERDFEAQEELAARVTAGVQTALRCGKQAGARPPEDLA